MAEESDFGLWLRKRRLERELTQRELADLSGLSRRWLVEIEASRAEPTLSAALRLIEALGADIRDVPGVSRSRARSVVVRGKLGSEEAEARRRELLLRTLALLVGSNVADVERLESLATAASARVDPVAVRDAEAVTALLMGEWYRMSPAALLPAAAGHLAMLRNGLPGSAELSSVAGWTACLTGHLLAKLDRRGDAYAHYALADSLARDAGDSNLRASTLVVRRGLCSWRRTGEPRRGLEFLAEAEATAGPTAPPLLRTVILATRAEDRATVGDEVGCLRDLEAAGAALSRPSADHFFGPRAPAELGAIRGTCESLVGRRREAVETFDWVLREMDPALVSWRATVAADREAALARS
jgi:transcriptional regulator with XRE-family HTH domain